MVSVGDILWFKNRKSGMVESMRVSDVNDHGIVCKYAGKYIQFSPAYLGKKVFLDRAAFPPTDYGKYIEREPSCSDCLHRANETCNIPKRVDPCERFVWNSPLPLKPLYSVGHYD